jgi:hypothetical protein
MSWEKIDRLADASMRRLAIAYSNYVMEYPDTHPHGGYPVCIAEFMDNDYEGTLQEKVLVYCETCGSPKPLPEGLSAMRVTECAGCR